VYWALARPAGKGDLVFVDPPASPQFEMARERGYLDAGFTPARTCALIKRVVAMGGYRVTISGAGVTVNGKPLANSTPCAEDGAGRPLRTFQLTDYVRGPTEVLLMSEYSPRSFDARYFGPLSKENIRSVIVPVITWK
jgi:conjugative transfer signal peptidase TraF